MPTPHAVLIEVWTDLQCAGGSALGLIPDAVSLPETRQIMGEDRLELSLPRNSAAWALLRERRALRVTFSDATFDEWRISELTEAREADGGLRSLVVAHGPDLDLGTLTTVRRAEADGSVSHTFEAVGLTVAQHLDTYILPSLSGAGASWFAAGTIDASAPVDLVYDWTTPKTACFQLAEALGLEFRLRRNGTSQYLLDFLTQIGSSAPRLYLQAGKNLLQAQRQRSAVDMATEVACRGAPEDGIYPTIAEALWEVASAPTATTLRLVDPNGGDGPVLEDDQLDGLYVRQWPSGSWVLVTGSTLANHEITTASAHGIAADALVQFATSSTGAALTALSAPSAMATYGRTFRVLNRPDIPATVNALANPAMRQYTTGSNAPPDGWAIIPGCGLTAANVDKETTATRWRSGGASAKVVTTGDGQGVESPYGTVGPTAARPHASGYLGFWNDTAGGKVRVDLVAGKATVSISAMSRATAGGITTVAVTTGAAHGLVAGGRVEVLGVTGGTTADGYNGIRTVTAVPSTTTFEYQLASDPGTVTLSSATARPVWLFPDGTRATAGSAISQAWVDLGWENEDLNALGATVAKMRVLQDGNTGLTFYVDRAQVTMGAGEGQRAFVEGSGPTQLWQAINRYLADHALPATSYEAGMVDLGRAYPALYTAEDVTLGGPVDLHDPEWGLAVSTRVVEVVRDLLVDGRTRVTLSNRPADVLDELVRPKRGNRLVPVPGNSATPEPEAYFTVPSSSPNQVQVRLTSAPLGATLFYWIGDAAQEPPRIGQTASGAPTAAAYGTYGTPFLVSRLQSSDLKLWVYAVQGGRTSRARPWLIDRDTTPTVTLTLTQPTATPGAAMKAAWTPDTDVAYVDLYVRRTASPGAVTWPTASGGSTGVLQSTYYLGRYWVTADGVGQDASGNWLAGALEYTTGALYGAGDWFAVIAVPYDRNGNVGARVTASLQASATTPASVTAFSATRATDGSACGSGTGARFDFSWTLANAGDGTHDLEIYADWNGLGAVLVYTQASPVSSVTGNWTSDVAKTAGKFDPTVSVVFTAKVVRTAGSVVEDTRAAGAIAYVSSCAVA
ncbi:MAG: hypothetical protein KA180_12010 [Gemmatimonadales bacterium]|nr:hypothetical protein [Gemmatimonadales bacterium]